MLDPILSFVLVTFAWCALIFLDYYVDKRRRGRSRDSNESFPGSHP